MSIVGGNVQIRIITGVLRGLTDGLNYDNSKC